ncbi:MAG: DctP family TRAP transporter solute-binding subunit [Deltaproteobacteria bacterium]|nr:DctP family TRAP transporter solute-binding subunit [Deltaproteobacteria bacterium]
MSGQAQAKTVMKFGHGATEGSAVHYGWVKFKELVEKGTNGEIVVEIYPNQQIGGDREMTEATQLGNIAGCSPSTSPAAAFNPNFFVFDVPFMFADRAQAYATLDGAPGKAALKSCEKYEMKGLGFFENGFRNLTNSKRPVRAPADVQGLKFRTMENPLHMAAWRALGANPTPMAFGELFTALQQKTVDGQENPMELIFLNKFFEVQRYLTKTQHIYTPYVILMNLDLWKTLTPAQQTLFQKSADEAVVYQRNVATDLDKKAEEGIRKGGTEVLELTKQELAAFQSATKVVLPEVKKRVDKEVYDQFIKE